MGKVRSSATPINSQAARNFPKMTSVRVTGRVKINSMVPVRRSSAQSRMPTAGDQEEENPGMPFKKCPEVCLAYLIKMAQGKREKPA